MKAIHTSFVIILLAAGLCSALAATHPNALTCGVDHAHTAPVRSSADFTAVLKMHSEDDHGKNTHLCATDYTLEIIRPDGSFVQPFQFGQSDDAWDRPLLFRIDGFSQDGNKAFVFISEGTYPQSIETVEYDMKSGSETNDIFLNRDFTKRLSRECAAMLRIVGTSRTGRIVLGSDAGNGCSRPQLWELTPKKITGPTARAVQEYPRHLSSIAGINKLEAGAPVQR